MFIPVQAQQVNTYGVCTQYREEYKPGYYDYNGNYVQGTVSTQSYQVPCNSSNYNTSSKRIKCDPTQASLGALLGGGIAASMSRGNGYAWSVPIGAAVGGAIFGCN